MGVSNLRTLVSNHPDIFMDTEFKYSRVVIDGANLVYHLYFNSGLDQNRGGEYGAFEDLVEQFILALRECGISPYVVFDGWIDWSDKKCDTVTARAQQKVLKATQAAEGDVSKGILPQMTRAVFKQTLRRLHVPTGRSYTEADQEMAALAEEWKCPVLSDDSDFFVFPISHGMMPFSHFRWQQVQQRGSHKFIPCKKFHFSNFCTFFGIDTQFLPVFAVLAGNDYVSLRRQDFNWIQFLPNTNGLRNVDELKGILCWLSKQKKVGVKTVFVEALKLRPNVERKERKEQLKGLLQAVLDYSLPPSTMSRFFTDHSPPPLPKEMVDAVPDWMRLPVTEARFSSDFLDILTMQQMNLSPVVEHKDNPSAKLVSRPLRRVLYALLLGGNSSVTVEERDREGLQLKHTRVQPATGVPLNIDTLHEAGDSQRLQVLLNALGVNTHLLSTLPPHLSHLSLPVAATCYWLQKATPPPQVSLLKALLICWCKGDTLRDKAAQDPDSKRSLDLDWCHTLNQWQSCVKESCVLNILLGLPLPDPPIARLYNGTLVHLLLHKTRCGKLKNFVKYEARSINDYRTLLAITHPFVRPSKPLAVLGQKTPQLQHNKAVDLSANALLLSLAGLDEEAKTEIESQLKTEREISQEEKVRLKTRHKNKDSLLWCCDVKPLRK